MKKIVVLFFLCVLGLHLFAQELTEEQSKLQSDILRFLKEEGYLPEIDKDGDIKFKKEGDTYYITIDKRDKGPLFIKLYEVLEYTEKYSRDVVKMTLSELNLYKGVKILCYENVLYVQAEMYIHNSDSFKYTFYKLMSQLDLVGKSIIDECSKVNLPSVNGDMALLMVKIPFLITHIEIANTDEDGYILTDYGNIIYNHNTKYLKPKITLSPIKTSGTYTIYVKLYQDNTLSTSSSSPKGYSYSTSITFDGTSKRTFFLAGWGSNIAGKWSKGTYRFEFWYDNYCLGSKIFEIK